MLGLSRSSQTKILDMPLKQLVTCRLQQVEHRPPLMTEGAVAEGDVNSLDPTLSCGSVMLLVVSEQDSVHFYREY